jgi:hypothetical protein
LDAKAGHARHRPAEGWSLRSMGLGRGAEAAVRAGECHAPPAERPLSGCDMATSPVGRRTLGQ